MIAGYRGVVLLDPEQAAFLAEALSRFFAWLGQHGARPSARLVAAQADLTHACARASESHTNARKVGSQQDSAQSGPYDLVDSASAARILGCSAANVRDLARRGRLPAHRAGGVWLYPAAAVLARAEQRARR